MPGVFPGRYTAEAPESFVVFVIGMRFHRIWAIHKWWPVFAAMPPMLRSLMGHPEKGYLGGHSWLGWRQVMSVQYWRSFAHLDAFARDPGDPHLPAWRAYNNAIGSSGAVGVWHETYLVEGRRYECVYANMPRFGLAAATRHLPATGNRETARLRLGRADQPVVESPPTPGTV